MAVKKTATVVKTEKNFKWVRHLYLYLVSIIAIVIMVISLIGMINLGLKEYVFDVKGYEELESPKNYWECNDQALFYKADPETGALVIQEPVPSTEQMQKTKDECIAEAMKTRAEQHSNNVKTDLINYISMLIVALPVYFLHWRIIRKEK